MYDKEQKERFTKSGKLDRDQYEQWKARSIEEFEAKDAEGNLGGTNYKDDGLDGTYNTLGRQVRLDDITKDFRTESLKVAALVKAKKWDALSRKNYEKDFIQNMKLSYDKLTPEMISKAVEGYMRKQPDLMVIVGQQEELNAVKEAQTLGIPTITLVDTDCNPKLSTYCIPANDDSVRSIQFILSKLVHARTS